MKRRQRKPVLDINGEQQSDSPRGGRWQNKYQQIAVDHPEQNGTTSNPNPLASLLGQYNSDSETETDTKQDTPSNKLNDKVNDFLKEIQMIAPDTAEPKSGEKMANSSNVSSRIGHSGLNETSNCPWQECIDETTGYPYYWHIETNEVTWEMPTEYKIQAEKCGQNNQSQMQSHQGISPAHGQIQWAHYLPNTYPEMQTNIPEGMIPKEVVARNRNRQVGVPKNRREDVERAAQLAKKTGGNEDYDSDEEKIEMITSFGNEEESESETSDNDSHSKKHSSLDKSSSSSVQRSKKSTTEKGNNPVLRKEDAEMPSIGPSLPPGIIPMIHGPENVVDEGISESRGNDAAFSSARKGTDRIAETAIGGKVSATFVETFVDDEDELTEKRKQRKGGEVEQEEKKEEEETGEEAEAKEEEDEEEEEKEEQEEEEEERAVEEEKEEEQKCEEEDIISQIEREMPVDHARKVNRNDSKDLEIKNKKKNREFKISLVAGYSDDSDVEEETSPKKIATSVQPLFPIILDYQSAKDNVKESTTLQVSRADIENPDDEEISTVENTGDTESRKLFSKIGADNDNAAADEPRKTDEYSRDDRSQELRGETNGVEASDCGKTEAETTTRQNSFLDNIVETPAKGFQRKKRIAFDVVPNKMGRSKSEMVPSMSQSSRPEPTSLSFSTSIVSGDETGERRGFGFHKEPFKHGGDSEVCDYPSGDANVNEDEKTTTVCSEQRRESQSAVVRDTKKGISFVKGETKPSSIIVESETTTTTVAVKKPEDNKELKELTDIVMEKIKFLSEGSQNLSAIQIMVIQLQTLVAAWESGELRESYLYEWLKGTGHELARLEEAAAPPGWDCHWDRSHKRYYYRNSATGEAQWTYPEADVVGGTEEMDLCTTPPPPEDEELQIIEEATGNGTSMKTNDIKSEAHLTSMSMPMPMPMSMPMPMLMPTLTITGDNKIIQITRDEYKSLEAPPPPQISSPSPPPPPRIFAEDLMKKGKKRRASANDRNYNSDSKREKTVGGDAANASSSSSSSSSSTSSFSEAKDNVDPPLPPSPPKNAAQPPLPPNPPHPTTTILTNPPSSEPLPPGVDPKDMPAYPLSTIAGLEPGVVYTGTSRQNPNPNPIYAATIAERGGIAVPIIDHRSAIIQGQLMHYPTYQHLHNQAMIAAAGSLTGQEAAVQFMITDYGQVYGNAQVIAKPPVKTQNESLGSALDSFYSDIATIEKTILAEQDQSSLQQDYGVSSSREAAAVAAATPPPLAALPNPASAVSAPLTEIEQQPNTLLEPAGKEKKRKRAKIGIGKKQKEMSSMVAKWQKAQQDFEDSD